MMNISASGTDDDLVIAIPDETVQVGNDDTVSVETPETKDAPQKRERGEGGRFSSKSEKTDDERAKIQRERDEFARVNADIQARLADAEARATAAAEARGKAEETAILRENQAMRAHWARLHSDKSQIDSAISATQIEAASAERDYIAASEAGDVAKQAKAQRDMAKAEAHLIQLQQGRSAAEQQIEEAQRLFEDHARSRQQTETAPKAEPKREDPPRQQTPDEWIDTVAQKAMGDAGAEWLRENRELVTDAKKNRLFIAFANLYAEKHGQNALRNDEFVDALNREFFPDRDQDRDDDPEPPKQQQRRAPVSAPVSRSKDQFFSSRNLNATQVKLPPRLAAFVKASGLDPTEYALQAVADIKAGHLPKNYLDPDYDHGI